MRASPALLLFAVLTPALLAQAPAASGGGNALPADQATALLARARARYSSLVPAGVESFSCDVQVNWDQLFAQLGVKDGADQAIVKYLKASRVHFVDPFSGSPTIEWKSTGAVPAGAELQVEQMQVASKTMVQGFLMSWTPALNGTLIPEHVGSVLAGPQGYVLADDATGGSATLEMDRDLLLTHVSFSSAVVQGEVTPTFAASPAGLMLTAIDEDYHQPAAAPVSHVSIQTTYAPVAGVQLPASLMVTVPGIKGITMTLTGCTVQKKS